MVSLQETRPPVLTLPLMDNNFLQELELNEQRLAGEDSRGAYQFGKAVSIDAVFGQNKDLAEEVRASTLSSGRWISLKDLNRLRKNKDKAPQFSVESQTSQAYEDDDEETMVWQLEVHSKSALSLNLIFSDFHLPAGTEFYVSGRNHILGAFTAEINNKPDGSFATAPVAGDRLLLEFFTPARLVRSETLPRIQLSHIIHGYRPMLHASSSWSTSMGIRQGDGSILSQTEYEARIESNGFSDQSSRDVNDIFGSNDPIFRAMSGKCNIDVACHIEEYLDPSRSVGVLLTDYNQKYCTGALINNARNDGRQLFLTANHCSGYSDTSSHMVMFNHQKLRCRSNEVVNEQDTAHGLVKVASFAQSDFTLYEISEPIPDSYDLFLAGWSASSMAPGTRTRGPAPEPPVDSPNDGDDDDDESDSETRMMMRKTDTTSPWRSTRSARDRFRQETRHLARTSSPVDRSSIVPVVGIHHPSGDAKKISFFFNGSLPAACWAECDRKNNYHWKIPRWDEGTTEPGSSGSPLFDADKRIVGQLHGGSASCWNPEGYDAYGALHASYKAAPEKKNRLSTYLDPDQTGIEFMDGNSLEAIRKESRQLRTHRQPKHGVSSEEGLGGYEKPLLGEMEGKHRGYHPRGHSRHENDYMRAWDRIWRHWRRGGDVSIMDVPRSLVQEDM
ncbi:hypothetical protein BGW38_002627 [Lunasporangiospora selenospora]|uniref:Trypsin-like peptidase domain-containing protein n=1 Tax=Lunasporangiospora selenospora TaxID=979761 RepID=A0A9P6FS34_9FUNG|nr:hypothetical protein BGW38_002627 [Lunasporangiospora selenospora]